MLHAGVGRRCASQALGRCLSGSADRRGEARQSVPLPDFNTDVNIHEHRLKRPTWQGLPGLERRVAGSLIPQTLREMEKDPEFRVTQENLRRLGQKQLTREERKRRQRALDHLNVPSFRDVSIGCLVCPAHFAVVGSLRGATPCVSLPNLVPSQCTGIYTLWLLSRVHKNKNTCMQHHTLVSGTAEFQVT